MSILPLNVSRQLIPIYEKEYSELCQNWSSLERKAQLAGGAVLAILTGGLALVIKSFGMQPTIVVFSLALLAVTLSVAGFFSAKSLSVTSETLAPPGEDIRAIAWRLADNDHARWSAQFEIEAAHALVVNWDQACKDLFESLEKKGEYVATSQTWLLVSGGISLAAFLHSAVLRIVFGAP